jgi:hypothetical protein
VLSERFAPKRHRDFPSFSYLEQHRTSSDITGIRPHLDRLSGVDPVQSASFTNSFLAEFESLFLLVSPSFLWNATLAVAPTACSGAISSPNLGTLSRK